MNSDDDNEKEDLNEFIGGFITEVTRASAGRRKSRIWLIDSIGATLFVIVSLLSWLWNNAVHFRGEPKERCPGVFMQVLEGLENMGVVPTRIVDAADNFVELLPQCVIQPSAQSTLSRRTVPKTKSAISTSTQRKHESLMESVRGSSGIESTCEPKKDWLTG